MLKLKRFEKNKRKLNSKYIIIASIMLIFMLSIFALYKSYALYKVQEEYDVIKSRIGEFNTEDIILSYTVNSEKKDINFPSKDSGYTVTTVECENATAGWDNTTWSLTNITPGASKKIKCNIDFHKNDYTEKILNGTDPVLSDNLVPVTIANDGTTLKAYNSKYYDEYESSSEWTTYSMRILGDATGEMGPFYYYQDGDSNNRLHNN